MGEGIHMHFIQLTLDELTNQTKNYETVQKAESSLNSFYNLKMEDSRLSGAILGNHGEYLVSMDVDNGKIKKYSCLCDNSKISFCKHAIGLGLNYIYTPWLFDSKNINIEDIKNISDLKYYIRMTKLNDIFNDIKKVNISILDISDLLNISVSDLSVILKDENIKKSHKMLEPIKISLLYILDKRLSVN